MKRKGNLVRRTLYKVLPLKLYLTCLSKLYFISFSLGLLKNNKLYNYPYFLKNVIKKGDVIIDIGANLGYLTTLFSKLVGNTGKVYAVEPVKPILEVLKKNTQKLNNVEILPFALGEENKSIQLGNNTIHRNGFMASGSHTIINKETKVDVRFNAEMKKGSEVFMQLEKLDFIKCDIEGYEVIVLQELESIILKHRPILLVEARRDNRKMLLQFFEARDFNNFILDNGLLIRARPEDFYDMLVVPREKEIFLSKFIDKTTTNKSYDDNAD